MMFTKEMVKLNNVNAARYAFAECKLDGFVRFSISQFSLLLIKG